MSMRVCIMGAGIGGLTAAHKLTKLGHRVDIFERNPIVGGLARSMYLQNGEHSEYCFHVFVNTYTSLLPLMKEIPFKGSSTVADQLKPLASFSFGCTNTKFTIENSIPFIMSCSAQAYSKVSNILGHSFTPKDLWMASLFKLFVNFSTPERFNQPYYDNTSWADLMHSLSPNAKIWAINAIGAYLGLETDRVNVHTILNLVRESYEVKGFGDAVFYCLNGPTNERWLDPWVTYLKECGVSVNLQSEIRKIHCEDGEVKEITVHEGNTKREQNLSYDVYINGLDVQSFSDVLSGTDVKSTKEKMMELSRRSYQIQPQVTFNLTEKVHFGETTAAYLADTPWGIMFRPESPFWDVPLGKGPNPPGEILSAGIGLWHTKGILFDKPAHRCTEEELAKEVWAQIQSCSGLMKHYRTDSNTTLNDVEYKSYNIWYSYSFDNESQKMDTWEPKFSNNVGTLALRPFTQQPDIRNLLHANAYTRTEANIFNMDCAAEAGIRAANYIHCAEAKPDLVKRRPPNRFWRFCQKVDESLLKKGYTNLTEVLLRRLN